MPNYEQLCAQQALRIFELEGLLEDRNERLSQINLKFVCIGGPLNDNVLGFNADQRRYLHLINNLAEIE